MLSQSQHTQHATMLQHVRPPAGGLQSAEDAVRCTHTNSAVHTCSPYRCHLCMKLYTLQTPPLPSESTPMTMSWSGCNRTSRSTAAAASALVGASNLR
jgi:hypothetical protein